MSTLFVANLSKYRQTFMYRVPEVREGEALREGGSIRHQDIEVGSQVRIPGELSDAQILVIIDHHQIYGMKSETDARKIKGFTGLVYSIGKPIALNEKGLVEEIQDSNDAVLNARSDTRREHTTAAISQRLTEVTAGSRAPLQRVEVEQHEETDGTPSRVDVGVEAVAEGVQPRNPIQQRT